MSVYQPDLKSSLLDLTFFDGFRGGNLVTEKLGIVVDIVSIGLVFEQIFGS